MFTDKSPVLLIVVLLVLELTAADDATETATYDPPEPNLAVARAQQDSTVGQDASAGGGKLSDWWNEYIEKVKASSPTPVWIKSSSEETPKKVPLWWLDVEAPSTTQKRLKHKKFPMEWPKHFLGHRDPFLGQGVPTKDHHQPVHHDHKLGQGETQKGVASCPPCPCQTTQQNCPHCGCQSTTKCHDQTTTSKSGDKGNEDSASGKDKPNDKDGSSDKDKPNDKDGSSDKDKSDDKEKKDKSDDKDKEDKSNDKDKSTDKDGSSDTDGSSNNGNGKTTKPFKKCTCITRPICGYPCPYMKPCTCPPKAVGRSGRSGRIGRSATIEVVKSDSLCQAVSWWCLCLTLPFLSHSISLI